MRIAALSALFFSLGIFSAEAQNQQQIDWKTWEELEQVLREEPKPVFVFFEAEWCAYCKKIKREVFTKTQVIKKLNSAYYALKMDVERRDTVYFDGMYFFNEQQKSQRHGIHQLPLLLASREGKPFTLPATLILDKDFTIRKRIFEYYTSAQLLKWLGLFN